MTRVKRTKNIFNQNIVNQSLFHLEDQGQYKIGGLQIKSDWLTDAPADQYIKNIYSGLKLAELKQQLEQLKDQAVTSLRQNDGEISSPTKANLFKIAVLKKKIMNFQVDGSGDLQKIKNIISTCSTFKISQPPSTENMLLQKLSTNSIALFQKPITRNCFLFQKILIMESKKNEDKRDEWTKIDLEKYLIEINHKHKKAEGQQKNQSNQLIKTQKKVNLPPQGFQNFQWVPGYDTRLLLTKKNDRSYCLYLPQDDVQKFFKYLKFHNFEQTLQKNKSKVFNELNNQMFQKVITLFGNKLRMYDYNIKLRGTVNQKGAGLDSPMKKLLYSNQLIEPNTLIPKKSPKFTQISNKQSQSKVSPKKQLMLKKQQSMTQNNMSEILFSPQARQQQRMSFSQIGNLSMFKLRTKKATVFYDQLQADVNIIEMEQKQSAKIFDSPALSFIKDPTSSPEFKISDINLNLKDEGMSQIDEDQSSRSVINNRKRTTNISVSGTFFHQFNQKDWDEQGDPKNRFNINIHQIQSDSDQKDDNQGSSKYSGSYQSIKLFNMGSDPFLQRNSTSQMSSLQLQQLGDQDQSQKHYSEPNQISPRSYQTTSSGGKQIGKLRLCLRQRQLKMRGGCYGIEMIYPYHKNKMRFYLMQVDPQIQMQKYQVVCSQAQFNFTQKLNSSPRYTHFQDNQNNIFGLNKDSNHFIFVLKQQSGQDLYYSFQLNMQQIRYQQDRSQLILIRQEDLLNMSSDKSYRNFVSPRSFAKKSSPRHNKSYNTVNSNKIVFKFAAILKLYVSPQQIQMWPNLSTTAFLQQYILMTIYDNHYDFKHNFVQRKMRYHTLRQQINKKCVKNMLQLGIGNQQNNFKQLVFNGLPQQVVKMLQKKLFKEENINKDRVWQLINFSTQLESKELKLLQQSIISPGLRNLKMIVKPLSLIETILNLTFYNKELKKRIYQISIFFLNQNSLTNILENVMTALAKQILIKLQSVLIKTKTQEQVKAIIKIYLQVQYQIDELFNQVLKYFM